MRTTTRNEAVEAHTRGRFGSRGLCWLFERKSIWPRPRWARNLRTGNHACPWVPTHGQGLPGGDNRREKPFLSDRYLDAGAVDLQGEHSLAPITASCGSTPAAI